MATLTRPVASKSLHNLVPNSMPKFFTAVASSLMASRDSHTLLGTRLLHIPVIRTNPPYFMMHMIPGTMGHLMPMARQAFTNATNVWTSKNICVMMKSA